jgi:hypothetical protein
MQNRIAYTFRVEAIMKPFTAMIIFLSCLSVSAFSQTPAPGYLDLGVGVETTVVTKSGFKLASAFGPTDQFYAVIKIQPLKPGVKYDATFTYEAGTSIYYGQSWVNGDPGKPDWNSFIGIGSGTGGGAKQPGYENKQLFRIDPKSTSAVIYLVVRSDKPWTFTLRVNEAAPGITREMKNKYGYYMVDDHTDGDKRVWLLQLAN